jgi:DNA-directed RNA polymerase subunit RPC12/RpoP
MPERKKWPDDYLPKDGDKRGVRCPSCNCARTKVDYTRHTANAVNLRRRTCANCGREFPTYERA